MLLRIAMTAHSLIYAPLYRAAERLNSKTKGGIKVELVFLDDGHGPRRGFGDQGAYEKLCKDSDIDLCLADPLVLAREAWEVVRSHGQVELPRGEIIAVLLRRPALWAVTTPATTAELRQRLVPGRPNESGSVANQLEAARGARNLRVDLGRICTYDVGSTAYRLMEYMEESNHFYWDIHQHKKVTLLGEEFEFFESGAPEGVDVVITCDCFLPYLYKLTDHTENKIVFAWHLSRLVSDIPFTALISRRDLRQASWARRSAVSELLRELQWVISNEVTRGQSDHQLVKSFLSWGAPTIPRAVLERLRLVEEGDRRPRMGYMGSVMSYSDGQPIPLGPKAIQICESLLQKLRQREDTSVNGIFPEDIRPDSPWLGAAWSFSFREVWKVPYSEKPQESEVRRCLSICVNPGPARLGLPKSMTERLKSNLFGTVSELIGEKGELLQVAATAAMFLAALGITVLKAIAPQDPLVDRIVAVYSPETVLGVILAIDLVKASQRRRSRLGDDAK